MLKVVLFGVVGLLSACAPSRAARVDVPSPPADSAATAAPDRGGTIDGIRYKVTGDGPVTLVLVHGNFDRLESWDPLTAALGSGFRIVALDLPGYGESENRLDDFSARGMAQGVRVVVNHLDAERIVLVGNSMGGTVVASYAAAWPAQVAGVVLEDANFVFVDEWPSQELMEPLGAIMAAAATLTAASPAQTEAARKVLREAVAAALRLALRRPGVVTDALVDRYTAGFVGKPWQAVLRARAEMTTAGLAQAFRASRAKSPFPVMVAWGLDDGLIPVAAAERTLRIVPDAQLWAIAGTGHAPHLERPAELAAAITAMFGPGARAPAAPPVDQIVVPEGAVLATPWVFNTHPRIERAVRRQTAATSAAEAAAIAPWLAMSELAMGDVDAAEAVMAAVASGATTDPVVGARHALARGLIAETRGQPAIALYLDVIRSGEPGIRDLAMNRLALADLDAAEGAVLDAALGAPTAEDSVRRRIARADRALAVGRYDDAVVALGDFGVAEPALYDLRRGAAFLGAGRLDELNEILDKRPVSPGPDDAMAAMRATIGECTGALRARASALRGRRVYMQPTCRFTAAAGHLTDEVPPPRLRDLAATPADPTSPSGAVERATAALANGDDAAARAALAAVPAGAGDDAPLYQRMRLALAAAAGDRRAVAAPRAALVRHGGAWPWRWALATTLHAAGKHAEAARELTIVLAETSIETVREDLTYLLVDLGRVDEARHVRAMLAAEYAWIGVAAVLPHQRRARATITPAPAPK